MHGREEGEERRKQYGNPHMRTVPSRVGVARDADGSLSSPASSSPSFFSKDGRKISVGDCALFKPPQDSPPFIGIVCSLTASKENDLKLGVNWLYRPTEVKLGKGILLEAAPNEVFYSFRRDAISAASLLHPCKVAFLPKGVELPPGVSSFVCRRVYDIKTSRLWWLTDKNYLNEQQEEVNQLLYKTRIEMHASTQPNGRSPKQMSGPMPAAQLKPSSDSVQTSSSFPVQSKGKKRERGDQSSDAVKRERSVKIEDGDPDHVKSESLLKAEIVRVTEKGPLVDSEGVERLVQVMLYEKNEKKADLAARSMLTNVIAGTDKLDCLRRFVQLRGLSVLDEWLQEIHKGKIGDGSGLKDNDKSVEEFLLLLLRALEKLPVNLQALQLCNIGKSVNHLRTHKNSEIQKKARSLVDTWKKRVEAEMNSNDAKSGSNQAVSWSARSRVPEVSHGSRQTGGSSDIGPKSPIVQLSSSKTAPPKLVHGETPSKPAAGSPGSAKLTTSHAPLSASSKDGQPRPAIMSNTSDLPSTASRDEKSSSSSPSHNNSQSCSSDHAKTGGVSVKEDARSSTAGSNKLSSGPSRSKKSINGFPGSVGRESGSGRTGSLQRNVDKTSQSGLTGEKVVDVPVEGNSHKLIVKIPNRGRSPAQGAAEGSLDDPSVMNSRVSSPARSERPDQPDAVMEEKGDACRSAAVNSDVNAESWQSNDFRDMLTACDEADGSDAVLDEEQHLKTHENTKKIPDVLRTTISSSGNMLKSSKLPEASLSSMNALAASCVNYSETNNPSASIGDDVGMNLLASVAAGEIFRSELVSPTDSPKRDLASAEQDCAGKGSEMKSSPQDGHAQDNGLPKDSIDGSVALSEKGDCKTSNLCSEELSMEESRRLNSSSMDTEQAAEPGSNKVGSELAVATSGALSPAAIVEKNVMSEAGKLSEEKVPINGLNIDGNPDAKQEKVNNDIENVKPEEGAAEVVSMFDKEKRQKDPNNPEVMDQRSIEKMLAEETVEKEVKNNNELKEENVSERDGITHDKQNDPESDALTALDSDTISGKVNGANECKSPGVGSKVDKTEDGSSTTAVVGATRSSDTHVKLEFDLNEGLEIEDMKFGEPTHYNMPSSAAVPLASPLPLTGSSSSGGLPAPIAVAAATKGSFVPPDDLIRTKAELGGWKGSAATSAFRPAEPRKVLETAIGTLNTTFHSDTSGFRQSRPPLDIDLNVADERIVEEATPQHSVLQMASLYDNCRSNSQCQMTSSAPPSGSGGLDLDLNRVDEATTEVGSYTVGSGRRLDATVLPVKSSGNLPNEVEVGARRDFDLNDGPVVDALTAEPSTSSQHIRNTVLPQNTVPGLRMNGAEVGNFSTWFHPGTTYSAVTIPSILSERGEQPFPIVAQGGPPRMLAPSSGGIAFSPEIYRGSVLSSSPAVPFPSTPFPYSGFQYGQIFPLPSASLSGSTTTYVDPSSGGRLCFPPVHSQLLGPASAVTSPFSRPYVVSLSDGSSNSGLEGSKKWSSRGGLDLNTGPGGPEVEGRDEMSPLIPRQLSVASSPALMEEQARMYQVTSGVLKRKEPDGGWDSYRQPSWQQ